MYKRIFSAEVQSVKKKWTWIQDQNGISLVESLVTVAIVGTAIVAALAALSTSSLAISTTDEQAEAQSLVRSQLEEIKAAPFAASYPVITEQGYDISVGVNQFADGIQKITVTVARGGETILAVEDYKVNR